MLKKEKPASWTLRVTESSDQRWIIRSFASPETAARKRRLAFAWAFACCGDRDSYLPRRLSDRRNDCQVERDGLRFSEHENGDDVASAKFHRDISFNVIAVRRKVFL
jgi:hypothetical protein